MYLPRELEKEVLRLWGHDLFIVLRGPRRAGKTTLMKHIQEIKGGEYINFENLSLRNEFLRDPIGFVESYGFPLYLDEIQYLGEEGASRLKFVYDEIGDKGQIIMSGSGAFDVKMKLFRYLVGRAFILTLLPLSFGEFCEWKGRIYKRIYREGNRKLLELIKNGRERIPSPSPLLEEAFIEYTIWGGYPEVVLLKGVKKDVLSSLVATTLEEDIIRYFSLREEEMLWKVVRKLAVISGGLLDYSSLGPSYQTASKYISILKRSFVLSTLPPFSTNRMVELTKAEKVYFYDSGFRNSLLGVFSSPRERADGGVTLENALFPQLIKYGEVKYWRTKNKAEVDFIVVREGKPMPIEVKSSPKLSRSLLTFIRRYKPSIALVATSQVFEKRVGETRVFGVPYYYF